VVSQIQAFARELGFSQIGVAGVDLSSAEAGFLAWLQQGFHGDMAYMAHHGLKRARPAELVPGTLSVITVRMDYLPRTTADGWAAVELQRLNEPAQGIVSLYARGRDYHKVLRNRLQQLSDRMAGLMGPFGHRVFTDSAPVLEEELASRSGLGWRGKHTLLLNRDAGSLFFLGEIFVDVALPPTQATTSHCGTCAACMDVCPTHAIVAPHRLDARRCISYLTIEHCANSALRIELRRLHAAIRLGHLLPHTTPRGTALCAALQAVQVYPPPFLEDLKALARDEGLWNLFLPTLREDEPGTRLSNLDYAPLAEAMGRLPWAAEVFNCSAPDTGNMELLHRFANHAQRAQWLFPC
jgi:epoxyqueuosine reductase QueG